MTVPPDHAAMWRAYIGPPLLKSDNAAFFDWSDLDYAATTFSPVADTTLALGLASDSMSCVCADTTGWPAAGGAWIGPNAAGEAWGYVMYSAIVDDILGLTYRDPITNEYNGLHTAGAIVRFWWPITENNGILRLDENMTPSLSAVAWSATLAGFKFPQPALRNRHLVLIQHKVATAGVWSPWYNLLLGWVQNPAVSDDYRILREWQAEVISSAQILAIAESTGLKVGDEEISKLCSVQASTTLQRPYMMYGTGEFTGTDPSLEAANVVDGERETLWISSKFIGGRRPDPTTFNPATSNIHGVDSNFTIGLTQAPVAPYFCQPKGYRWVEITNFANTNIGNVWLVTKNYAGVAGINSGNPDENMDIWIDLGAFSYNAGDTIVVAESATLFESEYPENAPTTLIDASTKLLNYGRAARYTLTATGATSGQLVIRHADDSAPDTDSGAILYNHNNSQILTQLQVMNNLGNVRLEGGPLATAPVEIIWETGDTGDIYKINGSFSIISHTMDVTPTLVKTANETNGIVQNVGGTLGSDLFNCIDHGDGILVVTYGEGYASVWSALQWGDATSLGRGNNSLWNGANMPGLNMGQTFIFDISPSSPTATADFWYASDSATPGYNPTDDSNGIPEWLIVQMPTLDLRLTGDIDADDDPIAISDAAGGSTNGLPASGTIQIGNEQITYTTKTISTISGLTRGANGTTAANHDEGDSIWLVDGGSTTQALPLDAIRLKRKTGQPTPADMRIYGSRFSIVRDPSETGYLYDWITLVNEPTGGTWTTDSAGIFDVYTLDLSSTAPRYTWLLIELRLMSTEPYRAALNAIEIVVDPDVYDDSSFMVSGTIAGAITTLLDATGMPSGAIVDNGDTYTVANYTTANNALWPVLVDMAEFSNTRLTIGRDSKINIAKDPFWALTTTAAVPAEIHQFDRDDIMKIGRAH